MLKLRIVNSNTPLDTLTEAHRIHESVQVEPWSFATFEDCLTAPYYGVFAYLNEEVVGFAIVLEVLSEATLMDIAVDKKARGKGLGKALLTFVLEQSKSRSMDEMWLDVRESNEVAISLYKQQGFSYIDTRKNYYPTEIGRENALVMKWCSAKQ